MTTRPIIADVTARELTILRWLAQGARIRRPSTPYGTVHRCESPDAGVKLSGVQRRLVARMVNARRLVWRQDIEAYVITEEGLEIVRQHDARQPV